MSDSRQPANEAEPEAIDPEILALLDFEPVPRAYEQKRAWTPELQRLFIVGLAITGSINKAADRLKKDPGGARKLIRADGGESFRAAAEAAEALWKQRNLPQPGPFTGEIPGPGRRKRRAAAEAAAPAAGQIRNEYGEWEDEGSLAGRVEDARDSISAKLRNCRRLYLREISASPGKRAAFEILTELPIDWEAAARLEPQADEPWRRPNMREPDMLLAAENGWLDGLAHGPDKTAELRSAIDAHRGAEGLEPVDWDDQPSP